MMHGIEDRSKAMKHITLIRHAKSAWDNPQLGDFDRPLGKRGQQDAPRMGKRLDAANFSPDVVISSSATRAVQTAESIVQELKSKPKLKFERKLYMAGSNDILDLIKHCDDSLQHIAIVSHNPGITALANLLGTEFIENIPTAGIVQFKIDIKRWSGLEPHQAQTLDFDYPKKSAN